MAAVTVGSSGSALRNPCSPCPTRTQRTRRRDLHHRSRRRCPTLGRRRIHCCTCNGAAAPPTVGAAARARLPVGACPEGWTGSSSGSGCRSRCSRCRIGIRCIRSQGHRRRSRRPMPRPGSRCTRRCTGRLVGGAPAGVVASRAVRAAAAPSEATGSATALVEASAAGAARSPHRYTNVVRRASPARRQCTASRTRRRDRRAR